MRNRRRWKFGRSNITAACVVLCSPIVVMGMASTGCAQSANTTRRVETTGVRQPPATNQESTQHQSTPTNAAKKKTNTASPAGDDRFMRVSNGWVDWDRKVIRVQGRGRRRPGQSRLMAERAALLDACRNAIALSSDLQSSNTSKVATSREHHHTLRGRVREYRQIESFDVPGLHPTETRVVIEVPLRQIQINPQRGRHR